MVGRVGNRYVWQGGQTENQGGQTKKFFRCFVPNFIKQMFAHPGLKPCQRPWWVVQPQQTSSAEDNKIMLTSGDSVS